MTAPASAGLTNVILLSPKRRVDISLPGHLPLAHLHPILLRHGGEDLVEDAVNRGGWVVRRPDGTVLDAGQSLAALGVRHGDVLMLSYRDQHWPEPVFDDIADGIAEEAARLGPVWRGNTSATAGLAIGASILTVGLFLLFTSSAPLTQAGFTAVATGTVLLGFGTLLARWLSNTKLAAVLGTFGMVYLAAGGLLILGPASGTNWHFLVSSTALLSGAIAALAGIGAYRWIFYAGATVGVAGAFGTLLAALSTPDGAVAGTVAALILLSPLLPRYAAHQGGLPSPSVPNPAHGQTTPDPLPAKAELAALVQRSDELLTGILTGLSLVLLAGVIKLAVAGQTATVILACLITAICSLRTRMFIALRHRLPLAIAGLGGVVSLLVLAWMSFDAPQRATYLAPALAILSLLMGAAVSMGNTFAKRPPSPGLGRLADVLEVLAVIATPTLACAVMGLFGLIRGMLNG